MKKIKFPLVMKNGEEVRDIDQLREHFDLEVIVNYYSNGKLRKWLENYYYDEILKAVEALEPEKPDFGEQLARALGAEWNNTEEMNLQELMRTARLKEQMRPFINEEKLEEIEYIADSQEELERLVKAGHTLIYLFGEKFTIKDWMEKIVCIGINGPVIYLEIRDVENYQKKLIRLQGVQFADEKMEEIARSSSVVGIYFEVLDVLKRVVENVQ